MTTPSIVRHMSRPNRFALGLFFSKIELHEDGCWVWRAARCPDLYGVFAGVSAHRISYRWFVAEIPYGYYIDHLCRHRWCVNPAHLEAVTQSENIKRGLRANAFDDLGYCQRGHRMTPDNMTTQKMGGSKPMARMCRTCQRLRQEQKQRRIQKSFGVRA